MIGRAGWHFFSLVLCIAWTSQGHHFLALDEVARVITVGDDVGSERKGSMRLLWNRSALRLDFGCFTAMESSAVSSRTPPMNITTVPVEWDFPIVVMALSVSLHCPRSLAPPSRLPNQEAARNGANADLPARRTSLASVAYSSEAKSCKLSPPFLKRRCTARCKQPYREPEKLQL